MAISKTITTIHGFIAKDAYVRIEEIKIIGKDRIETVARFYLSADKPSFGEQPLSCLYDLDGHNPIKQAYQFLKTLPEFSDAVDC
jgi:hypothetical protein